jgi:polyribonucleotide nucleotidyltransferase
VDKVENVCKVGDKIQVKVIAIDEQDRVKLSRKALLREQNKGQPPSPGKEGEHPREGQPGGREGHSRGREGQSERRPPQRPPGQGGGEDTRRES